MQLKPDLTTTHALESMALQAIGCNPNSVISIMGSKEAAVQRDIPIATEMYSLLLSCLPRLSITQETLSDSNCVSTNEPRIVVDAENDRILLLYPILEGELSIHAFHIAEQIKSAHGRKRAGNLVLPFSLNNPVPDVFVLLPEWFGAFVLDGDSNHCVPILLLKSVLAHQEDTDGFLLVLYKLESWGIPCKKAIDILKSSTQSLRI